jgi:hypothetical protein
MKMEISKQLFSPNYKEGLTAATAADSKFVKLLNKVVGFLGDKEWFLGYPSVADVQFAYFFHIAEIILGSAEVENPMAAQESLKAHYARVWELDGIKEYVNSPEFARPFLPPTMVPWLK